MTLARANSWRIGKPTLLSSLAKVRLGSVVSIVAPAGYGKTTALQAWQENADLRAIGVRLGPEHNDEAALALHLIDALGGLVPTVRDVMEGGRPGDADWGRALLRSLSQTYLVLMLDDVHQLTDPGALRLVKQLVVHTPRRMVLAVSSRNHPYVSLARARVEGRLLALTGEDLVLSWRRCAAASEGQLPDDHAASALWWRICRHLTPTVANQLADRHNSLTTNWLATLEQATGPERAVTCFSSNVAFRGFDQSTPGGSGRWLWI